MDYPLYGLEGYGLGPLLNPAQGLDPTTEHPPHQPATAAPKTPAWDAWEMGALRLGFAKYGRNTTAMLADPALQIYFRPERTPKAVYQRISGCISVNVVGKRDAIMVLMHHGCAEPHRLKPCVAFHG